LHSAVLAGEFYKGFVESSLLRTMIRGFDAQVNGAMVGVPQFRVTFG